MTDTLDSIRLAITPDGGERITIFAAPDLAYRTAPDDTVVLVDWKTGTSSDVRTQLAVFAIYLRQRFGIRYRDGRFVGRVVGLGNGTDHSHAISRFDFLTAYSLIQQDAIRMRAYQLDRAANIPVDRDQFAKVGSGERSRCASCNYYRLCHQDSASRDDPTVE